MYLVPSLVQIGWDCPYFLARFLSCPKTPFWENQQIHLCQFDYINDWPCCAQFIPALSQLYLNHFNFVICFHKVCVDLIAKYFEFISSLKFSQTMTKTSNVNNVLGFNLIIIGNYFWALVICHRKRTLGPLRSRQSSSAIYTNPSYQHSLFSS